MKTVHGSDPASEEIGPRAAPASRAGVRRSSLLERLLAGGAPPLLLIAAPAGYGKSTLLRQWQEEDERPFAWLSLDPADNDPILLISSIASALDRSEPVPADVFAAAGGVRPDVNGVLVPRLCAAIRSRSRPFVLVLDDVHTIANEAEAALVALAGCVPDGSVMALATRAEPQLPLGTLRAQRSLAELRSEDLAMTRTEAKSLLEASGLDLPERAIERLVERTEGWPAGLYLSTYALEHADDPAAAVEQFHGDDRVVADYLRDELLDATPADDLDFLVRTSILDELSGPSCDRLLERDDSGARLLRLARSNHLVIPLDRRDRHYRYHALLREMLEGELHRLGETIERALHTRAADWARRSGDVERAVHHAVAASDPELAGEIIWEVASEYASHGREATLRSWVEGFDERTVTATPTLALTAATLELGLGNGVVVERSTAQALAALGGGEAEPELTATAGLIRAAGVHREGLGRLQETAGSAAAALPATSDWRALCLLLEGTALMLVGDLERAAGPLLEGSRRAPGGTPTVEALCMSQLALIALEEDQRARAVELVDRAIADVELHGLHLTPTQAIVFATAAFVRALEGRSDEASRHRRRAAELGGQVQALSPWYEAELRIVRARAALALDDVEDCRALLAAAEQHLHEVPDAVVLREWLERAWAGAELASADDDRWPLTPAELRLLHQLPTHRTFPQIATELYVSTNTVKTHARSIYGKLDVSSRAEAVEKARDAGLLRPER